MKNIVFIFFLLIEINLQGQDPLSSQFYFNPIYMNPAFVGFNHSARIGGNVRNQWTAIPSKFVTYNCWADIYTPALSNGGLGVMAMQDVSGEGFLKTTSFGVIQAYEFILPNIGRLRTGYNVTVVNKKVDWNKLVFSDQLDGLHDYINPPSVIPGNSQGRSFADINVGFLFDFAKIKNENVNITQTAGYSCNHLLQPNESLHNDELNVLPIKHTYHYAMILEFPRDKNNSWYISPNFIYERQGLTGEKGVFPYNKKAQFSTYNIGFYIMHKPLISGIFYRKRLIAKYKDNDSFILFLGLYLQTTKTKILKIGYSYDFTINKLHSYNTLGSHEISLSIEFKDIKLISKKGKKRKKNKRVVDCTDFGGNQILF
jgi:type IX secretion system PorP/SprF family membrane protein